MAGRDSRTANSGREGRSTGPGLVRLWDPAGRPRGTGFAVDHDGTVITGHEAVDGIEGLLQGPDERVCAVSAAAVTPLPHAGLALVRTEGLGLQPLPVTVRDRIETGTYVRIAAGDWREARVLATTAVTYRAPDRHHRFDAALELAGTAGTEALRTGGGAAGGPVLDAATGAVLAVLGTALHTKHRTTGFAVPLLGLGQPLEGLLARNAETVPAYGADLNLAGVLALTASATGSNDLPDAPGPVRRAAAIGEFAAFDKGTAAVLGLVGPPGSGRTTELASLAARRTGGSEPAPVLWLRGADLEGSDTSLADAVGRALERSGRIMAAGGSAADRAGEPGDLRPERLARVARNAGRPLLLLLDDPERMPLALAHRLPEWTAATAAWLRETGTRLVVASAVRSTGRERVRSFRGRCCTGGGPRHRSRPGTCRPVHPLACNRDHGKAGLRATVPGPPATLRPARRPHPRGGPPGPRTPRHPRRSARGHRRPAPSHAAPPRGGARGPSRRRRGPRHTSGPHRPPPGPRRNRPRCAGPWIAGRTRSGRHDVRRRWPTGCGPPRTSAPRPIASCCATRPWPCSPVPPTAPCTAVRSPCSSMTR
ncbi:hypothetical protein GCM10022206_50870 [Streptomyces chiangmaiensis]